MTCAPAKLNLVNVGLGMPTALAAKLLGDLGASAERYVPASGDPFEHVYPAYAAWNRNVRLGSSMDELEGALANADVLIAGGESWPGLDWSFDLADISRRFPRLVILEITGYATRDAVNRPAVDLLVQARTGLAHTEYATRPKPYALPAPTYGAAMMGVIAVHVALRERDRTGKGQIVRTSLQQGAALWVPGIWSEAERRDASFNITMPKDVREPVFRCLDDEYLIFGVGTPGCIHTIYKTLEIDKEVDPMDRGLPDPARGPEGFFCDRNLIEPAMAVRKRDDVLAGLWAGGVAADRILPAGAAWDDEQVVNNGIIVRDENGGRHVGNPFAVKTIEASSAAGNSPVSEEGVPAASKGNGPLSGIRIVDLGAYVAGPFSGKLLAEMGADVIKVEAPSGDPFRWMYRNFASVTRGKRSLAVDLKSDEGQEILRRLVRSADIFAHNMRMGVA